VNDVNTDSCYVSDAGYDITAIAAAPLNEFSVDVSNGVPAPKARAIHRATTSLRPSFAPDAQVPPSAGSNSFLRNNQRLAAQCQVSLIKEIGKCNIHSFYLAQHALQHNCYTPVAKPSAPGVRTPIVGQRG
jgi:hypothetical protein